MTAAATTKRVRTPVLEIAYEERGPADGPPVLLLHGFPDDVRCWDAVADGLAAAGRRTLAPYLRGFGPTRFRSDDTPRDGQFAALGQDAIDFAEALDLRGVTVVGQDWGSPAAEILAAFRPDRVTRLVKLNHYGIYSMAEMAAGFARGEAADYAQLHALHGKTVEQLLKTLDAVPEAVRTAVRNNGGGHANHQLFWKILKPGGATQPGGELAQALARDFGSVDAFKAKFEDAGAKQFGSGWAFLVVNPKAGNRLEVVTRPNQDSVLPDGLPAVFGNDLWEHAYYLKYQNKRADYLKAFWGVLNWTVCGERYTAVLAGQEEKLGGPAK